MLFAWPALAADWTTTKLRGTAEVFVQETWMPLKRGDVVTSEQQIRTLAESRLELQAGDDIIVLGPDTLVSIEDQAEAATTIIHQEIGTVEIEAEVRDAYHLAVQTKFLAAVVKGTHFIVTADENGASVDVTRGLVAVRTLETNETTDLPAGTSASVRGAEHLLVAGALPLPLIFDAKGTQLERPAASTSYRPLPPAGGSLHRTVAHWTFSGLGITGGPATIPRVSSGLDMTTTGLIGVVLGIMIGALGLLVRRVFR